MKTTGQDATPKPDRNCATCGTPLGKDEYELCGRCRERLEGDQYGEPKPPSPKDKPDRW
jgi:predicted amidophosphoribosyltransferase